MDVLKKEVVGVRPNPIGLICVFASLYLSYFGRSKAYYFSGYQNTGLQARDGLDPEGALGLSSKVKPLGLLSADVGRATIIGLFRVPLNLLVCGVLVFQPWHQWSLTYVLPSFWHPTLTN